MILFTLGLSPHGFVFGFFFLKGLIPIVYGNGVGFFGYLPSSTPNKMKTEVSIC